jgi:Mg2+ and Co2+ transporter CorA
MSITSAKCNQVLDESVSRGDALTGETQKLSKLIFNIATLQDTKASAEQSIAANNAAGKFRRVTALAFIRLPLMLVASTYGMNVQEIPK